MKKLTLINGGATACLILMCLFLANGCKRDLLKPNSNDFHNGLSIAEAKQYFDQNISNLKDDSELNPFLKTKIPNWQNAYYRNVDGQSMIKVPLTFDHLSWGLGKSHRGKINYDQSNYLLIYKDSLKNTKAEWVGLYPDSAWAYGSRKEFTGDILIRDWSGKLKKLIKYEAAKSPSMYIRSDELTQKSVNVNEIPGRLTETVKPNGEKLMSAGSKLATGRYNYSIYCTYVPVYQCVPLVQTSPSDGKTCSVPGATRNMLVGYDASCVVIIGPKISAGTSPELEAEVGKELKYDNFIPVPPEYHGLPINTYPPSSCLEGSTNEGQDIPTAQPGENQLEHCINPITEDEDTDPDGVSPLNLLINSLDLTNNEITFLQNNYQITKTLSDYLTLNGFTEDNKEFINWAVGYLMYETFIDINTLKNIYLNSYSESEMIDIVNTMQDPITGNGIELYLIVKYRGSKTFNLGSESRSNEIEVGSYTLRPFYNKNGAISFYVAARLGGGGSKNGPEYLIKADQLNAFRTNVNYYTAAANWFYANGIPSPTMIKYIAGPTFSDKFDGLLNLWGDALKSPDYWAYLISCFVTEGNNPKVRSAVNDVLPEGAAYTKSSLEIGQQMHRNYKVSDVIKGVAEKEYVLPSGRRIDFLDIRNKTIYELKPNNPRQIASGKKQLQIYLDELKTIPEFKNITWKTILDLY